MIAAIDDYETEEKQWNESGVPEKKEDECEGKEREPDQVPGS